MRFKLALLGIIMILLPRQLYSQVLSVRDINWDKEKCMLTYSLSEDAYVKARVGQEGKDVYRTIVNFERRQKGLNKEHWNGKDESGKIEFDNFGKLHFCVLASDDPDNKDVSLKTSILGNRVTIDLGEDAKAQFLGQPAELKAYLDNQLVLAERIDVLPYSFNIKPLDMPKAKYLLTINLWQRPQMQSCAYGNLEVVFTGQIISGLAAEKNKPLAGKLAFCQFYKGYWQVWVADINGSGSKVLTRSPIDKRYPCFSPSGKEIAYVTNTGELSIMDSDGKNNRMIPLAVSCYEPKWSGDGKKLVFTSYEDLFHSNSKIWILDLETQALTKVASRPFLQYNPNWSGDDRSLIFIDGPELYAQEIRRVDLVTGDVSAVTDTRAYVYEAQPSYLPDGRGIVYSSNDTGSYNIRIMDKIGCESRPLTKGNSFDALPVVSKDGNYIFFLSDRSGLRQVWRINKDGEGLRQITKTKREKQDFSIWTE